MDEVIRKISVRVNKPDSIHDMAQGLSPAPKVFPVASAEQVAVTEAALGFTLPALLRRIYLEIGNGGLGPGYGFIGVEGGCDAAFTGETLAGVYASFPDKCRDYRLPDWPDKVLPICTWGCDIYSCVDCTKPEYPVLVFNPEGHVLDNPLSVTLTDADGKVIEQYTYDNYQPSGPAHAKKAPPRLPLFPHKESFELWITEWARGADLWTDFFGE